MKWYFVTFQNHINDQHSAAEFIKKFGAIHAAFKEPKELCLFELKFEEENSKSYYISCPEKYDHFLKVPLAFLRVIPVSRPNLKVLKLICGSLDKQNDNLHSP